MQFIDAAQTEAALPMGRLIAALRERFATGCTVPGRQTHQIPGASGPGMTTLIMPAWVVGGCYGVKIVNVAPGNVQRGLPGLHATYLLHDATTGVPLALMDGDTITARRTAAASALAACWLARPQARHLLVVGAGRVARLLPQAYRCVRPIQRVSVWARRPEAALACAAALRGEGFEAAAVKDLAGAVGAADIISCATLSNDPLVQGAWLRPGSHLDLIGGFTPVMREADDACFSGASVYVDTEEALAKSGDLLGPMSRGVLSAADVRGTLASLADGSAPGRDSDHERTVFKSVGTGLEDLAAAMLVMATVPS
jgi:ornithine cyclodeaminase